MAPTAMLVASKPGHGGGWQSQKWNPHWQAVLGVPATWTKTAHGGVHVGDATVLSGGSMCGYDGF